MNIFSKLSIKIFTYEYAQTVPMARTFISKWFLKLNIKLLSVSINARNKVIIFVEAFRSKSFFSDLLID